MVGGKLGFLKLEQGGFEVEERGVRSEVHMLQRHLAQECLEPGNAFEHGDLDRDLAGGQQIE